MSVKDGNCVGAREFSDASAQAAWDAFDRLPVPLRIAMVQLASDFCAAEVMAEYQRLSRKHGARAAMPAVLDALLRNEQEEIEEFAAGQGYCAHLAAGATIQRYGRAA